MLLPAGTYKLRVVSQVYGEISKDVTVEANKVTMVDRSKK
ncbi:MAG: PEGA domain-containing protein [Acidobacteria bacterium]|nr:PEGA domain-containing protein [Acidobacteriota bacterium]